ncbi:ATP-binding cassette domain-containing protein, partial [Acinetobacter baumannii]
MLQVTDLHAFYGRAHILHGISLEARAGEVVALLGRNGAGKSTLVKMLFGSLEPYSGEISWNGEPVKITSPSVAKKLGIGMVFQHFSLFEALSAAENIALSLNDQTPISTIAAKAKALSYSYGLPLDP